MLLWRGDDLTGSDVDLLVSDAFYVVLARLLRDAGFVPAPGDSGHVTWSLTASHATAPDHIFDVMLFSAWPKYYPDLAGVFARAHQSSRGLLVTSTADRGLIFVVDALLGRSVDKLARRLAALRLTGDAADLLDAIATDEHAPYLARLARQPHLLEGMCHRGRVSYPHALSLASRSRLARTALQHRARSRIRRLLRLHGSEVFVPSAPTKPLLVTVSGLDGAGKSTAVAVLCNHLTALGQPTDAVWGRLGGETAVLERLAGPVKRALGRDGTIADPIAAGGPSVTKRQDPREARRRTVVSWFWILAIALIHAWSYRRTATLAQAGRHVICDRWTTDALIDLELRYGRHRLAHTVLRLLSPRRDLGILLQIDAETAADRKPGDQAGRVLALMEPLYAERARRERLLVLDATMPESELHDKLCAVLDATLARG